MTGRQRPTGTRRYPVVTVLAALTLLVAACSSSGKSTTASSTTTSTTHNARTTTTGASAARPLRILVTNDDGYNAPGIDAVVRGLTALPDTQVTVVAPATNESGSGGKTTAGTLTVTDGKTASGYPAKAVHGFPADTVRWAVDDHGVSAKPDVVVSGVNFGQNIGPLVDISGTVGAARAAASRGIPALAVSAGFPPADVASPNFAQATKLTVAWITAHRAGLLAGSDSSPVLLQNLNVPTCPGGAVRGEVTVPVDASAPNSTLNNVNCTSTATNPTNDVQAFSEAFEPLSNLSVTP
jgi:5'-nucleotidase